MCTLCHFWMFIGTHRHTDSALIIVVDNNVELPVCVQDTVIPFSEWHLFLSLLSFLLPSSLLSSAYVIFSFCLKNKVCIIHYYYINAICCWKVEVQMYFIWALWLELICGQVAVQWCSHKRVGWDCFLPGRWLPSQLQGIITLFKLLLGCAPSYLSDTCKSAPEASRRLHLSGDVTWVIPWSRTRLCDGSFDVAGPRLWNKLPASLWSSDSLCQFRRQLKTFLFVNN